MQYMYMYCVYICIKIWPFIYEEVCFKVHVATRIIFDPKKIEKWFYVYKLQCLVRLYPQLFVGECISYWHYLCLFMYSGVQHILCYVFLRLVYPMLPISLDCHFFYCSLVFSKVYLSLLLRFVGVKWSTVVKDN